MGREKKTPSSSQKAQQGMNKRRSGSELLTSKQEAEDIQDKKNAKHQCPCQVKQVSQASKQERQLWKWDMLECQEDERDNCSESPRTAHAV